MNKQKKNNIQLIILMLILIIVIIFAIKILNKNSKKQEDIKTKEKGTTAIDINDPTYEGMRIYKENGDTIIESAEGSKTVETTKTKQSTGMVETTEKEKNKYEISNINVSLKGSSTIITGKVKNNDNKEHDVIVTIKFYSDDNKIKGEASAKLELESKSTKDFNMTIMEDVTKCKYNIEVEYAK